MISLATFVKNEAISINSMINSVYDYVDEIVVVDTGSTDDTLGKIKDYQKLRVYKAGFTDFGSIRTLTAHLCREPWILMLDADETLDGGNKLWGLTQMPLVSAWAFPRKRWLDPDKQYQTEVEAYPDYQVRFFRNNPKYTWKRELHEYFDGCAVTQLPDGPIINHFQDVYKDPIKRAIRDDLYNRLAKIAKVQVQGGKPV